VRFRFHGCPDATSSDSRSSLVLFYRGFEVWLAGRKEIEVRSFVECAVPVSCLHGEDAIGDGFNVLYHPQHWLAQTE
jgi:hypothetical protein